MFQEIYVPSTGLKLLEHVVRRGLKKRIGDDEDHESSDILLVRNGEGLSKGVPCVTVQDFGVPLCALH